MFTSRKAHHNASKEIIIKWTCCVSFESGEQWEELEAANWAKLWTTTIHTLSIHQEAQGIDT